MFDEFINITMIEIFKQYFEKSVKKTEDFKIGIEFESLGYNISSNDYPEYKGKNGIEHMLHSIADENGFEKFFDKENIIYIVKKDFGNVSVEPGGQIEFSSTPQADLHALRDSLATYLQMMIAMQNKTDINLFFSGTRPTKSPDEMMLLPKQRYGVMYNHYMPKVGKLGRYMMKSSTSIQVALDYSSIQEMLFNFKLMSILQPFVNSIFLNSPLIEGKITEFKSFRMNIWQDTDKMRSGVPDFLFGKNPKLEEYIDQIIKTPIYYALDDDDEIVENSIGMDFLEYIKKYPKDPLEKFLHHLNTIFYDVRTSSYIENRAIDGNTPENAMAVVAIFTGVQYSSQEQRERLFKVLEPLGKNGLQAITIEIMKNGLDAKYQDIIVKDVVQLILEIATDTLEKRNIKNKNGNNETIYLKNLLNKKPNYEVQIEEFGKHGLQGIIDALALTQEMIDKINNL